MTLLLGLDIATTTGFAWYQPADSQSMNEIKASLSSMEPGSFKVTGEEYEDRAADMSQHMIKLIKTRRPDLIIIEKPIRNVMQHRKTVHDMAGEREEMTINAGTALLLNQLTGCVMGIIRAYNVPYLVLPSSTWRKASYGFGTHKGWTSKDWKKYARTKCAENKIVVTNDDMAEACWIAKAGEFSRSFIMMQRARQQARAA
jgi:Holliday junction resolvasome RuvABC endonuclease subunit